MDNLPPHIKNIMSDRTLTMKQKVLTFMMIMDPKMLPDNPNAPDFTDLGKDIKKLIDENKINIEGFDNSFNIKVICN